MSAAADRLAPILARKARENARRHAHLALFDPRGGTVGDRRAAAVAALARPAGASLRVIAELKFASPSEGRLRAQTQGEGARLARSFVEGGAAAVSVLCDRAGFAGGVLELRRVARAIDRPVLFKEFVLDPLQIALARVAGASMVLLLVRALDDAQLRALVAAAAREGLEPIVEAASEAEVARALAADARVIGVNARDLSTFAIDPARAARALAAIPASRVRVYMSGIATREELLRVEAAGADAALVGTVLMRATDPGAALAALLGA